LEIVMKTRFLILPLLLLLGGAVHAQAQQPQKPTSAAQEGFVPVDQLPQQNDRIPAPALVGTAYAFVWVALFGYIWTVWRRLTTVERELQAVSRRVGQGARPS
jgi:CcmD family protein